MSPRRFTARTQFSASRPLHARPARLGSRRHGQCIRRVLPRFFQGKPVPGLQVFPTATGDFFDETAVERDEGRAAARLFAKRIFPCDTAS